MNRRALLLALALLGAACQSTDPYDEPRPAPRAAAARESSGVDFMPPDQWWRDARFDAVNLSNDQVAQLDKISRERGDDIRRLENDVQVAQRDLRTAFDADPVGDVAAAAQRVRTLRDDIFDRHVQMLAAERNVLTRAQWSALEESMRTSRREDRGRGNYPGGGRGGFPGGRRGRPGWPG